MANKTLKTRILLKTDTTDNWEKAANSFIPKEGEVCIYSDRLQLEDGTYVPGIKVGDGSSYINELEFMGDDYISNEEIDEILGSAGGGSSTIRTCTLTFPSMKQVDLENAGILSTDYFYFTTWSNTNSYPVIEKRFFWDVCFYDWWNNIEILPNTFLYSPRADHWTNFKDPKYDSHHDIGFTRVGSNVARLDNSAVLEWDGPREGE